MVNVTCLLLDIYNDARKEKFIQNLVDGNEHFLYIFIVKKKNMKTIDYTVVEEYLDSLLEDDPAILINGITPLYKQVAAHFRPKDRKHSIYSVQSVREAVRTYFDEHNVDHKIAVKLIGYERKGMVYSAEHRKNIGNGVRNTWTPEKRAAQSRRIKECWAKRRNK